MNGSLPMKLKPHPFCSGHTLTVTEGLPYSVGVAVYNIVGSSTAVESVFCEYICNNNTPFRVAGFDCVFKQLWKMPVKPDWDSRVAFSSHMPVALFSILRAFDWEFLKTTICYLKNWPRNQSRPMATIPFISHHTNMHCYCKPAMFLSQYLCG